MHPAELIAVAAALAVGYVVGPRRALAASVSTAAAVLVLEGAAARLGSHAAGSAAYALAAALAVLAGARLRRSREPGPGLERYPRALEDAVQRARQNGHSLSLVAVRPDDAEADRDALARNLALTMRAADSAGHDGSDVWLVLPETTSEDARTAAERFRLAAGAAAQPVSIGIASFPADGGTGAALAEAASEALERAAALGGNRTLLRTAPEQAPPGWGLTPSADTTLRS